MKTALALLVLLSSANAFAGSSQTFNYTVSAPSVVTSQPGVEASDVRSCPNFSSVAIQQDTETLEGLSFVGYESDLIAASADGSSRTCYSDVVCPTEDHFRLVNGNGSVSVMRNNDGEYPTTDLSGYSSMAVYKSAGTKSGKVACYYTLTPQ